MWRPRVVRAGPLQSLSPAQKWRGLGPAQSKGQSPPETPRPTQEGRSPEVGEAAKKNSEPAKNQPVRVSKEPASPSQLRASQPELRASIGARPATRELPKNAKLKPPAKAHATKVPTKPRKSQP